MKADKVINLHGLRDQMELANQPWHYQVVALNNNDPKKHINKYKHKLNERTVARNKTQKTPGNKAFSQFQQFLSFATVCLIIHVHVLFVLLKQGVVLRFVAFFVGCSHAPCAATCAA
eukprot:576248-Amphidinium_carterae.1